MGLRSGLIVYGALGSVAFYSILKLLCTAVLFIIKFKSSTDYHREKGYSYRKVACSNTSRLEAHHSDLKWPITFGN